MKKSKTLARRKVDAMGEEGSGLGGKIKSVAPASRGTDVYPSSWEEKVMYKIREKPSYSGDAPKHHGETNLRVPRGEKRLNQRGNRIPIRCEGGGCATRLTKSDCHPSRGKGVSNRTKTPGAKVQIAHLRLRGVPGTAILTEVNSEQRGRRRLERVFVLRVYAEAVVSKSNQLGAEDPA